MNPTITISGIQVSYDRFLSDLAKQMVSLIRQEEQHPEYLSQQQAYRLFGRANVQRWRRAGLLRIIRRPGKLQLSYDQLHRLYHNPQDYQTL